MIRNLRTGIGFIVLVALVLGVAGAVTSSATVSGHFVSGAAGTKFNMTETTASSHATTWSFYGSTFSCHNVKYHVHHASASTFTSLTVTPTYENCTIGSASSTTFRMNGCHYELSPSTGTGHGTFRFVCPSGKKIEFESGNGLQKLGAQTITAGGVTYTNLADGTLTINVTAEGIHAECHGLCQFLGTNTTGRLVGSVRVEGFNTVTGTKVNLSAT